MLIKRLMLVIVLLLMGALLWPNSPIMTRISEATNASAQNNSVATLEPLAGLVRWQAAGSTTWETVLSPIQVGAGDSLQTGAEGWALLTFFDGAWTELFGNTHLVIRSLQPPANPGGMFTIQLDLLVGDTYNSVQAVVGGNSRFDIQTPSITASVRGTEYFVMASPSGQSMIVTAEGSVMPQANEGDSAEVNVNAVEPGQTFVWVEQNGQLLNTLIIPRLNFSAPLAPDTCGDNICQPLEALSGVCEIDCAPQLNACGDGYCDYRAGEGLLTCAQDCSAGGSQRFELRSADYIGPDRFDFGDALACLETGTCADYCTQNPKDCEQFETLGYVDCNDPANAEQCSAVFSRPRPGSESK